MMMTEDAGELAASLGATSTAAEHAPEAPAAVDALALGWSCWSAASAIEGALPSLPLSLLAPSLPLCSCSSSGGG